MKDVKLRRGPRGRTLVILGRNYLAGAVYRHPDNPACWKGECYDLPDRRAIRPTRREAVLAVARMSILLGDAKR